MANGPPDASTYFAAERTFLAWIRTGIALMGFGFVLARFGIFLRQFQLMEHTPEQTFGASVWLGVTLLVIGVVVMIAATLRHVRLVRCLRLGEDDYSRPSRLGIVVATILAVIGVIMAVYLIVVSHGVVAAAK